MKSNGKPIAKPERRNDMNCFYCKGILKESFTNHVVNLANCIIIVKNVPCLECVQCGETFFNDDVAMRLEEIVNNLKNIMTEIAVVNYSDKVA